jgi:hypothetical protein
MPVPSAGMTAVLGEEAGDLIPSDPHTIPSLSTAYPNNARWSRRITFAALWPGAPVTPPPGWAPEPQ